MKIFDDGFIIGILLLLGVLFIGSTVHMTTMNKAVENCITANQDWTVAAATTYCTSIVKEGKRP